MTSHRALLLMAAFVFATVAEARLGETERELIARFGQPVFRGQHSVLAQGRTWVLGPTLDFKQDDDWRISCDLVDDRVARISYTKHGDWTEEQVQLVLSYNSQGAKWMEEKTGQTKIHRSWKRSDGAVSEWTPVGINFKTPAYDRARNIAEAKAKAEASKKPRI